MKSIIEQWKAIEIAAKKYNESLKQLNDTKALAKAHGMTDQQIEEIIKRGPNTSQTKS